MSIYIHILVKVKVTNKSLLLKMLLKKRKKIYFWKILRTLILKIQRERDILSIWL